MGLGTGRGWGSSGDEGEGETDRGEREWDREAVCVAPGGHHLCVRWCVTAVSVSLLVAIICVFAGV